LRSGDNTLAQAGVARHDPFVTIRDVLRRRDDAWLPIE
jgi:hypothetical protein